jgi:ankyrin repeat protein
MTTSMEGTLTSDLQERLCTAACAGPLEHIRAPVNEGADVVQHDAKGLTALHYAACSGNVETVRVILELGGNAHARSVAIERHTEPSRIPIALQDTNGLTPLDMAADGGYTRLVRLLVTKMGGDALAPDTDGNHTPLHWAAVAGHKDTVKMLLELGRPTCMHRLRMERRC